MCYEIKWTSLSINRRACFCFGLKNVVSPFSFKITISYIESVKQWLARSKMKSLTVGYYKNSWYFLTNGQIWSVWTRFINGFHLCLMIIFFCVVNPFFMDFPCFLLYQIGMEWVQNCTAWKQPSFVLAIQAQICYQWALKSWGLGPSAKSRLLIMHIPAQPCQFACNLALRVL